MVNRLQGFDTEAQALLVRRAATRAQHSQHGDNEDARFHGNFLQSIHQ
jgi:hypothetical protein